MIRTINPVAFQILGWPVHWYGLLIGLGIISAYYLVLSEASRKSLDKDKLADILFWTIIWGVVGARFYYVLFRLDYYIANPNQILQMWHGGGAIYGAIIGGSMTIYIMARRQHLNVRLILDIAAPGIILAQAIGRWGNFINQEAYGGVTSLAQLQQLHLPQWLIDQMWIAGAYRQPTFLYESCWSLIGFLMLLIVRRRQQCSRLGELAAIYLCWYGLGRFWIEGLRTDSLYLGPIRISQLVSVCLILGGLFYFYYNRKYEAQTNRYYNV